MGLPWGPENKGRKPRVVEQMPQYLETETLAQTLSVIEISDAFVSHYTCYRYLIVSLYSSQLKIW